MHGLSIGCVNVRGWGTGKLEDLSKELEEWKMDIVGVTETHLRDNVYLEEEEYVMIGKGRRAQTTRGGGVALLYRKGKGFRVEEIDVGTSAASEDVLAMKVECVNEKGKSERMIVIVAYMTVEGERAVRENRGKYEVMRKTVRDFSSEKVLIMGDMNGHVGVLGERMNRNGELLDEFVNEMNLENLNVTMAEGRVTWSARDQVSAIDYVLVNGKMRECVSRMWIDEDGMIDVVSDHNMLVVECNFSSRPESGVKRERKKWRLRDARWEDFQVDVAELDWLLESVQGVDEANKVFIENVRGAATRQIGHVRRNGRKRKSKPWWSREIKDARDERKRLNRICRRLRKQRHESDDREDEYQDAWAAYTRQRKITKEKVKDAKTRCEKSVIEKLREKGLEGGREWYRFLRGESVNETEQVECLSVNNELVTDVEKMKECIKNFWENIGGMSETFEVREECVTLERKEAGELNERISREEVKTCVEKQRNCKAAGMDEIPYEFYKNGGNVMIDRMTELFNRVWEDERVPNEWNECRVTLLHKGKHKSKRDLKNYRPIALGNTIGKIFSAILNERLCKWIEKEGVLGEEQNGFRVDRRAEDNMFIINEMIERKKKDGSKLYLGFLDIEKAYDRVSREVLYRVLEKIGLSEKIVRIIKSMYVNTRAKYNLGTIETGWVRSKRGVRQGCILSPTLFSLYTEELAARLRRKNVGVRVGENKICVLLYADDVVVMSESAEELQELLDVVSEYGNDFGVNFSSEKSQVMVVNGTDEERNRLWMIGNSELKQANEYKYLGVWMSPRGCERTKNEKISLVNQWVGRLGSIARTRACKYDVLREVWKTIAVPSVMYGMEVTGWNESEMNKLEVGQNRIARIALNAPSYAAVEALRGDMGWSSFRERYRKAILRYKARLERMNDARLARKVYLWGIHESKWIRNCMKMAVESGMRVRWVNREEGRRVFEWKMTNINGEGLEWDVKKWKRAIDSAVKEDGLNKWKGAMERKSTLEWYKSKEAPQYVRWCDGSLGGDLLFQARSQCMNVNARNYRWSESRSKECQMCARRVDETVVHVMLFCERYQRERTEMMRVVLSEMGGDVDGRTGGTEREWMVRLLGLSDEASVRMIEAVKSFLEKLWHIRNRE